MSFFLKKYDILMGKRPLFTKCATNAVLVGLGDAICQNIEMKKEKKPFNFKRLSNFTFYGFFFNGPFLHIGYAKIIPRMIPGNSHFDNFLKVLWT